MSHQIISNAQRPQAMFAETDADHSATHWQPPGQAKKHHHADIHSHDSNAPENSQGSPADASLIGWLKNKLGPMLAAVQQRNAQQSSTTAPTEDDIKQQVAVAAAVLVSDNQLWTKHKQLDTAALKDIVAHPSQHPASTVQAAQTMLDHPTYFAQAGGHHKHGHTEGEVRRQDLIKLAKSLVGDDVKHKHHDEDEKETARYREAALAAAAARAAQQANAAQPLDDGAERVQATAARKVLQADASLWAGKTSLSVQDLEDILKNPTQHPPETVGAALYVLQHPAAATDARMSAGDTDAYVQSVRNSIVAEADKNTLAGVDDDADDNAQGNTDSLNAA